MKEFEVTITETLQKSVVVEADSKDDAIQMVEDMWKDADIILDSENFVGVEYESDNGMLVLKLQEYHISEVRQKYFFLQYWQKYKSRQVFYNQLLQAS